MGDHYLFYCDFWAIIWLFNMIFERFLIYFCAILLSENVGVPYCGRKYPDVVYSFELYNTQAVG